MNWIKKTLGIGEKIKRLITKHRPTKEETEKSDCTSFSISSTDLDTLYFILRIA